MINILRPIGSQRFLSADVFERNFRDQIGQIANIQPIPYLDFLRYILKDTPNYPLDLKICSKRMAELVKKYHYICCANDAILVIPLILALRNLANIKIRLLFISHAPGGYCFEWALAGPLLQPGDVVIAPSPSARDTINLLYPIINPYVKVINHPMPFLQQKLPVVLKREKILVTLARIHEDKLLHRQIEAMEILHKKYNIRATMLIAGFLGDKDTGKETAYVHLLKRKIERLNLESMVRFVGPLVTAQEKADILAKASVSINLSACIEEAFPKAVVESLGMGVPVVATNWDGMRDTVGDAGILVSMKIIKNGHLDVDPSKVAAAIAKIIKKPIPAQFCRKQAAKYLPGPSIQAYKSILNENMKYQDFSNGIIPMSLPATMHFYKRGILSSNPFLNIYSYQELFGIYWDYLNINFYKQCGVTGGDVYCIGERIHGYLLLSLKKVVESHLANKSITHLLKQTTINLKRTSIKIDIQSPLVIKLIECSNNNVNLSAKEVLYLSLISENELKLLASTDLKDIKKNHPSITYNYIFVESLMVSKQYDKAYRYFIRHNSFNDLQECDSINIKQICRISTSINKPEWALPWIDQWLALYPDAPQSGEIWLRKAFIAWKCGLSYVEQAEEALKKVKGIYPDDSVVLSLAENVEMLIVRKRLNLKV